jgi:hypothetical protein
VHINIGGGTLTVTGTPVFMYNSSLYRESSAELAWALTGARTDENSGLLFIRDRRMAQGLFGKIAQRGNFLPLAVSVLLVIVCGFWMVIPLCGPVHDEKKPVARPLRQRFGAEIRFLSKYNALESYLHVYLSRLGPLSGAPEPVDEEIRLIEQALKEKSDGQGRKPIKYRDTIKALRKIQIYMEHV